MKNTISNKDLRNYRIREFKTNFPNRKTTVRRNEMKKFMVVAIIVLGSASMLFAQSNANTGVNINAAVIQGLTLTVSGGPLNFGTVVAGTTPTPISALTSTVMFTATGNGASAIVVSYSSVTLTSGTNTLTYTPSVYGASSSSSQGSSTQVTSGTSKNLSGTSGSAGNYYFWLGGDLGTISSSQAPGSYSGTFTLTVHY